MCSCGKLEWFQKHKKELKNKAGCKANPSPKEGNSTLLREWLPFPFELEQNHGSEA